MSAHTQVLVADKERVRDADGVTLRATIWDRRVSDEQLPGESWLGMRNRTEQERESVKQEAFANARLFAAAPKLLSVLSEFPGFLVVTVAGDAWVERMRAAIKEATAAA